jgi:hypothetical protein
LTRIAIHILVKKGEILIWRKNGHFPHCAWANCSIVTVAAAVAAFYLCLSLYLSNFHWWTSPSYLVSDWLKNPKI